jgi:hypothetical protein
MSIAANLIEIKSSLPKGVSLVAVSKTKPLADILEAYNTGQRIFGENKVQELTDKFHQLPKDIEWHMIGHLQTNKVKYIAPFISMIHSVDSLKLLSEINKEALKNNRTINCLLQFHIAEESTKFGLNIDEAISVLQSSDYAAMKNVRIKGVMGMATFTDDNDQVRKEFAHLKNIFNELKESFFSDDQEFSEISMGMSDDYQIAIEEGSTFVRIGSTIFGSRIYH